MEEGMFLKNVIILQIIIRVVSEKMRYARA